MRSNERRRQHRYVVEGVNIIAAGESYPVIDISVSGARVSCAANQLLATGGEPLVLEFRNDEIFERFEIPLRILRTTDLYVVIGYDAPMIGWEAYLRRFDTFHVDLLETELFD